MVVFIADSGVSIEWS